MSPEVKAKWLAALRSGKYEQGVGRLKSRDEYCCLGVLCDLYAREHGTDWLMTAGAEYVIEDDRDAQTMALPVKVAEWAGLDSASPRAGGVWLTEKNDGGASFAEIADLIEAHL